MSTVIEDSYSPIEPVLDDPFEDFDPEAELPYDHLGPPLCVTSDPEPESFDLDLRDENHAFLEGWLRSIGTPKRRGVWLVYPDDIDDAECWTGLDQRVAVRLEDRVPENNRGTYCADCDEWVPKGAGTFERRSTRYRHAFDENGAWVSSRVLERGGWVVLHLKRGQTCYQEKQPR